MKKITYLDTYNNDGLTYEDYKESCEVNGCEPLEEDSEEFYNWLHEETNMNVECFFENLKYSKDNDRRCVVSGRLGLWHGTPTIVPVMCENLDEAIRKCSENADDIVVKLDNGAVKVDSMHHDGTNHFEIRPLTMRGAQKMLDGEDICPGNHWHTSKYGKYLY